MLILFIFLINVSGEKFNKSMRFFASLRMTNKVALFLMFINQPFPVILRTKSEGSLFKFYKKPLISHPRYIVYILDKYIKAMPLEIYLTNPKPINIEKYLKMLEESKIGLLPKKLFGNVLR